MFKYGVFSGPYFSAFGLITEIYGVYTRNSVQIQKNTDQENSILGDFSRSLVVNKKDSLSHMLDNQSNID